MRRPFCSGLLANHRRNGERDNAYAAPVALEIPMPKKNTVKSPGGARTGFIRVGLYLKEDQLKALKHRAIDEGKDYSAVARDALEAYLALRK